MVDLGWRGAAAELKDGMGYMLPAARTRANATYYGFIVLSLGIIVMVCHYLSAFLHLCQRLLLLT